MLVQALLETPDAAEQEVGDGSMPGRTGLGWDAEGPRGQHHLDRCQLLSSQSARPPAAAEVSSVVVIGMDPASTAKS